MKHWERVARRKHARNAMVQCWLDIAATIVMSRMTNAQGRPLEGHHKASAFAEVQISLLNGRKWPIGGKP